MAPVLSTATRLGCSVPNCPTPDPATPALQLAAVAQISKLEPAAGTSTSAPKARTNPPVAVNSWTRLLPGSATTTLPAFGAPDGATAT
jgi:hypothetical protein